MKGGGRLNARDRAVTRARMKDPAANHAAAIVIYDLNRTQAYETEPGPRRAAAYERVVPPPPAAQAPAPEPKKVASNTR